MRWKPIVLYIWSFKRRIWEDDRIDQHAYKLFIEWNFTSISDRFAGFPMELFTVEKGEAEILYSGYREDHGCKKSLC